MLARDVPRPSEVMLAREAEAARRDRGERRGRRGAPGSVGTRWRAAAAVLVTMVMLLGSIGMTTPTVAQGTVLVPNVVGMPEADAVAAIGGAGLVPLNAGSNYDLNIPLGSILSSDPPAGTEVLSGSTVNYVVSAGPPPQSQQPTPPPTPKPTPTPTPKPPPTPKPTPWPTPAGVKGVDVSHWNGAPNFQALRGYGMEFVFSKASQGTTLQDETYLRNTQEARAAGLHAGAYHFFDYRKGGKAQARHFLGTLQATTGVDGLLPLVVDVETLKSLGIPNPTLARKRLHDLLDELYRQTGRYAMIYTSREMWKRVVGEPDDFGGYRLWVACWKCDKIHMPRGWSSWQFWQVGQFRFTDGVRLDGNKYRSTRNRLRKEVHRPMRLEKGREWASSTAVSADLRGYDGTEVRVALDGGGFGPWTPYQPTFPVQLGNQQGPRAVQLQLRSFRGAESPVLSDDILLDSVPPKVKGPRISLVADKNLRRNASRVPITASMSATDKTSGLASSTLQASCKGSKRAGRKGAEAITDVRALINRSGCQVTGAATDNVGLVGTRALSPKVSLADARSRSGQISLKGAWKTKKVKAALGKTLAQASGKGARAKLKFKGEQFAIVASRGPSGGQFDVIVDGKRVDTVSLYAKKTGHRRIVYVGSVKKGKHTVQLRSTGTSAPAASGVNVWLDAFLVLDRRK